MRDSQTKSGASADVRMRGFARRTPVAEVLAWLEGHLRPLDAEQVSLEAAAGRVLAADVSSRIDVPGFDRAMMDGFALHSARTLGASAYNRLWATVTGEALPGQLCGKQVGPGDAVRIMTGAPMPAGADSVLPAEMAEQRGDRVDLLGEVPPGKHVGRRGEDVKAGDVVLRRGRRLRPQDVGVISSIGVGEVVVVRRPRVRIVVTGSELLPAGSTPEGCRICDANGPMLTALVARDGGVPDHPGVVTDEEDRILAAMRDSADVVLVSGGSSVGQEDLAPMLVARHGELAIHGVAMRPSSPAGIGLLDGRLVFLLPGNPVSCLCAYDFFAGRATRALAGLDTAWPYEKVKLPLRRKLVSKVGRVDYARVSIIDDAVEPLAVSGASILTTTTRADGFVNVPQNSEGWGAGEVVEVMIY